MLNSATWNFIHLLTFIRTSAKSDFFFYRETFAIISTVLFLYVTIFSISQVLVGTRQTWSAGAKHSAKTSSLRRNPRLSWSSCGRPYRTSHSSSWRLLPSSLLASLSTSLPERTAKVRRGTDEDGVGFFARAF